MHPTTFTTTSFLFTFQSGSIQMLPSLDDTSANRTFTFQSGSIQISVVMLKWKKQMKIYIPIWFYSNPIGNNLSLSMI